MQLFGGVGLSEIIFILVLMIVVLGPKKMAEGARDLGKTIRKVTHSQFWKNVMQTSREIKDLPRKIMDETELEDNLREINRAINQDSANSREGLSSPPEFKPPHEQAEKSDRPDRTER
ncbi:MAG TPA: twin-arginine translocase TatA/TatE family subunit [Anaerolineaceae bacterium]|nr:twin-arginine translocase TatA/TatE family subunit [Anaerolineaceae bacterium]